jgi:hypothetical protein
VRVIRTDEELYIARILHARVARETIATSD